MNLQSISKWTATFFGVGYAPKAPGTWGSIAAMPFVFLISLFPPEVYIVLTLVIFLGGALASQIYGKGADNKEIVIDEVCGVMVTFFLIPHEWYLWVLGFFLFRFFDILKPFPISLVDKRMKGGMGVMSDDVLAGLASNAILHFVCLPLIAGEFHGKFF